MHVRISAACVILGLLSIQPHLQAADEDPFLQSAPAATSTQPATPAWFPENLEQRRQAANTRHQQDLAALQKSLLDVYAVSAPHNPKWDEHARSAILAFAASRIPELSDGSPWLDAYWRSNFADQAGCRDSLIEYILARTAIRLTPPSQANDTRHIEAGLQLQDSQYPDLYKACGLLRRMEFLARDTAKSGKSHETEIADAHTRLLELVQNIAKAPPIMRSEMIALMEIAGDASDAMNRDRMKLPAELLTIFGDAYPDRSSLLTAEAAVLISYAWDARGSDWASTVSEQGWDQFGDRLNRAQMLLVKAWDLDHDNAPAAKYMVIICKGKSHPRPIMEQWFKAAVAADPDSDSVYEEKLDYLEPKWGGSPENMIKFGRECLALPEDSPRRITIAHVYLRLSRYEKPDYSATPVRSYFTKSANKIWPDIEAAFEPYIKARGLSRYHQLHYARLALWCNHPDKARELLRNYENWPGHWDIGPDEIEAMRKELDLIVKPVAPL